MNMFWNGRWSAVTGESGSTAFVHVLRAATIVAVASSCSTMKGQSEADLGDAAMSSATTAEYPPPDLKLMTEEFKEFLAKEGYQDAQFATIAYLEDGQEKLIALESNSSEGVDPDVDENEFLIPPVGTNFEEAIVVFTGSPARLTRCGRRSAGTRYCDFN